VPSDVAQLGPAVGIRLTVASYTVDVTDDFAVDLSCEPELSHFGGVRWINMVAKVEAHNSQSTALFDRFGTFERRLCS
jgi:hypothetical protein